MADLTGKTIANRYRVDSLLGHGGMGDVYKVWDRQRAAFLAMKVLHADMAEDRVFLRRFAREAETLSTLQHPQIVRFYGLEQEGRITFMLMDYVEGTTLRGQIFDLHRPFTAEQVLQIMRPVCSALYYAHQMGRVHCDVKPANIMLKSNGEVVVADFGIARMMESSTTTTMAGAGTPAYMAPEQVLRKKHQPQTDIYALGIVLFEMLTGGERPFTGEQAKIEGSTSDKVRWEQVEARPPPPRKYNPVISSGMEAVIMKCLQKDPAQRYASALELLQAVELALGNAEGVRDYVMKRAPIEQPAAKPRPPHQQARSAPSVERKVEKQKKPAPLSPLPIPELVEGLGEGRMRAKLASKSTFRWLAIGGIVVLVMILGAYGLTHLPAVPTPFPTAQATSTFELPTETPQPPTETSTATLVPTPTLGIGSIMISDKDGMNLVYVPAGNFLMGSADSDSMAQSDEKPQHIVYLDAFWIDQTDITNGMYAKCVSAGACNQPTNLSSSARSSYYGNSQFDNYPVIYVNWNMADTYCKWAGRQLPTEAEWEKAARGTDGRTYPWGNDPPDNTLVNFNGNVGDTSAVGSYPKGASFYGAMDMAGNVWQWVVDWYSASYYQGSQPSDPLGPASGQYRVLRGGAWLNLVSDVRSANRYRFSPSSSYYYLGFRCSRSQ